MKGTLMSIANLDKIEDIETIDSFSKQLNDVSQSAQQLQELLANIKCELITCKREFLTSEEAASYLCISLNTLRAYCSQNRINYFKHEKLSYFKIEDLNSFVMDNKFRVKTIDEIRSESITKAMCHTNQTNKNFKINSKGN